ncbi:MAG: asparaginase [Acutalibacteraceae bacterium]|nr:asparaginase [Acutalibacteraceae bacterium]
MRILLILTGGTIACTVKNNKISASADTAYDILNIYKSKNPACNIEFIVVQPFTILSENYTSHTYNMLIEFLYSCDSNQYDGVIITHGSDTLSYTSALVGMLLREIQIPVLLTAADYPLNDPRTNGLSNFSACVEFIKSNTTKGVFTAYGTVNNTSIYLATRICEADPVTDTFSSLGNGVIAQIINGKICNINTELIELLKTQNNRLLQNKPIIKNDILLIKTYPNQSFDCYNIDNTTAVVIYMYHSATACTVGENTNICKFIEKCNRKNVPVYLASHKVQETEYTTSYEIAQYPHIKLYNISKESAYTKALLAYNQSEFNPEDIMKTNIYFEENY